MSPCEGYAGTKAHHESVRYIAVREHYIIDMVFSDQILQILLFINGDPFGIERAAERRRIPSSRNVRYLCCGECDDVIAGVVPVQNVEVVKIASRRTGDHDVRGFQAFERRYWSFHGGAII